MSTTRCWLLALTASAGAEVGYADDAGSGAANAAPVRGATSPRLAAHPAVSRAQTAATQPAAMTKSNRLGVEGDRNPADR